MEEKKQGCVGLVFGIIGLFIFGIIFGIIALATAKNDAHPTACKVLGIIDIIGAILCLIIYNSGILIG